MKSYIATYTVTFSANIKDDISADITQEERLELIRKQAEELYQNDLFGLDLEEHKTEIYEFRQDENGNALNYENGRYVNRDGNYGYNTHFGGLYVCYTCGHLCECEEEKESEVGE